MRRFKLLTTAVIAGFFTLVLSSSVFASAFCDGFKEGYKSLAGNIALVPICPIAPITPIGSTPFREGIKAGMAAAKRDGY